MKSSDFQKEIALKFNLEIDESSFEVAASQLLDFFELALGTKPIGHLSSTMKQKEFAKELGINVEKDSIRVASAKISVAVDQKNRELLKKYDLKPGKQVKWKKWDRIMVISSISENCRLWFKGGNGWGAFPHEIEPL